MNNVEVRVAAWPVPRGYANGRLCQGRALHVAGQIGWNARNELVSEELVGQFAQALDNVIAVVRAAGGAPADVASMTAFVTDVAAYRAQVKPLGAAWRERFGKHFPAMALVGVTALVEPKAVVEIQAIAYIPDDDDGDAGDGGTEVSP